MPAEREVFFAFAVGEEAVVADPDEALRQDVQEEAPDELGSGKAHEAVGAAVRIIFVAEGDMTVAEGDEAAVGDGDTMGVAGEVL